MSYRQYSRVDKIDAYISVNPMRDASVPWPRAKCSINLKSRSFPSSLFVPLSFFFLDVSIQTTRTSVIEFDAIADIAALKLKSGSIRLWIVNLGRSGLQTRT